MPDNSLDLIIMNPPFTRPTNHEGDHADVINPAVAAFGATEEDMDEMGKRLNALGKGTCYHASIGIASAFAALANKKLKPGGILALVLPLRRQRFLVAKAVHTPCQRLRRRGSSQPRHS